jgi:predicted dehydrogenase
VTVAGLGVMGLRHARVLAGLGERFELVGAYDVRGDRRPPPGVPELASEAEVIAGAEVIVVATPIGTHADIVARALAAGRHVLVEKPLCATALQADGLVAAAARGSARLFVGHSERFNPVVRALAKLVRSERVVAIDLLRVGRSRPSDSGVLVNLGVHDFDLAAYLGGGHAAVRGAIGAAAAHASVRTPEGIGPNRRPGDDLAHVLLTTAAGALAHVHVDRTVPETRRALVLATSRWIYQGDLLTHRLVRTSREGGVSSEVPLLLEEPLAAQAAALADALDGAPVREIATAVEGARAVALAEEAARWCAAAAPVVPPRIAEKL